VDIVDCILWVCLGVLGLGGFWGLRRNRNPRPSELVSPTLLEWGESPFTSTDYILVILYQGEPFTVRGYSTVWKHYPSGKRIPTGSEILCSEFYTQINWGLHQDRKKDWFDLIALLGNAQSSKGGEKARKEG
jgi:hypothetical protein